METLKLRLVHEVNLALRESMVVRTIDLEADFTAAKGMGVHVLIPDGRRGYLPGKDCNRVGGIPSLGDTAKGSGLRTLFHGDPQRGSGVSDGLLVVNQPIGCTGLESIVAPLVVAGGCGVNRGVSRKQLHRGVHNRVLRGLGGGKHQPQAKGDGCHENNVLHL